MKDIERCTDKTHIDAVEPILEDCIVRREECAQKPSATYGGAGRNRTADEGFLDPCLAARLPRRCGFRLDDRLPQFRVQDDGLSNVLRRPLLLLMPAPLLERGVGIAPAHSQVTLQYALGAFDKLSCFRVPTEDPRSPSPAGRCQALLQPCSRCGKGIGVRDNDTSVAANDEG
jgi:hypothetical protein